MIKLANLLILSFLVLGVGCSSSDDEPVAPPTPSNPKNPASLGRLGNATDVQTNPTPCFVLMGGGTEVDEAIQKMTELSDNGDFVVIRVTGGDAYNDYIFDFGKSNSVETLRIDSQEDANNTQTIETLRNAEALFIAGGDQAQYVALWKDTQVGQTLNYLIHEKKIPIGGTSAGCAILGEFVFDAKNGTIRSEDALQNPYHQNITFTENFLSISFLKNVITDTHYDNPDRKGRHLTFLARLMTDKAIQPKGIGVEERTAVVIDNQGDMAVYGSGKAYFLEAQNTAPEICATNTPLTWEANEQAVKVYQVEGQRGGHQVFNALNWTSTANATEMYLSAKEGNLILK